MSQDKDIIVTRPDNGKGVVILNRSDYERKILTILGDEIKFALVNEDIYKLVLRFEDKYNRLIDDLFKKNIVNQDVKNELKKTGSRTGIIYGLPKIHKKSSPLRPILSTIGSYNYALSKHLIALLSSLSVGELCVCDSFDLQNK